MTHSEWTSKPCSYCAELAGDAAGSYFLAFLARNIGFRSRILFYSASFHVFPSVGPLSRGHVLIVPKFHVTASSFLNNEQLIELECIILELKIMLQNLYNKNVLLLEHGVVSPKDNQDECVNHAHIHLIPADIEISEHIKLDRFDVKLRELNKIKPIYDNYIIYSDNCSDIYYSDMENIPSQYLRKIVHENLKSKDDWNWRNNQNISLMRETYQDLKSLTEDLNWKPDSGRWLRNVDPDV